MADSHVTLDISGPVAILTMNRPNRRNALSLEHMLELRRQLEAVENWPQVAAVILRGAGEDFCSGHDLTELVGRDPAYYGRLFDTCVELMETVQRIPQPVIAQVQGVATAAGCQLVATCDLAVAAADARFATPGVRIGLFCSTPMVALSRAVPRKKALEMLLTGDSLSAEDALRFGLVSRVVAAAELEQETLTLARRIAAMSRGVVATGKAAFYQQIDLPQAQAYAYTKQVMAANASTADAQEGIRAFLEKRAPAWGRQSSDS